MEINLNYHLNLSEALIMEVLRRMFHGSLGQVVFTLILKESFGIKYSIGCCTSLQDTYSGHKIYSVFCFFRITFFLQMVTSNVTYIKI